MKRAKHWLLMTAAVLLLSLLASTDAALPFKKVSIAKTPASTSSTTTTTTTTTSEPAAEEEEEEEQQQQELPSGEGGESKSDNGTVSKNSKLTGIPQIDYIWDPNLPRELRGFNLSTYPFLSTVPPQDEIHFKCEGLHDGFYASIEYKCQIYHHCVYGIRHDFLCANFTAFDQRTFICHFASDVDCEGSQKYWNRNDELYMATTTTSTSTSTTQPPPTSPPARRRNQRPLRRRRPIDDYYYEEDQYDDYYEERLNRRHKLRPRHRKPQVEPDYDDEYEEKKPEEKPLRRNRNRYRDEEEETQEDDYEERRNRRRGKPSNAASSGRKVTPRKPGRVDERRSFNEERPLNNRRRLSEKRTTPIAALDDLDEYEKPEAVDQDQEAAEEHTSFKVKTTPKPLTEFVTPKAAAASVYARPRAPPRIARPVPVNEKKKYSYPVQKNTATTPAPAAAELEDEDYLEEPHQQQEDDYEQAPAVRTTASRRRTVKPTRSTLRKPVTDRKPLDEEYYEEPPSRKRTQTTSRSRLPAADVDFVDEDYEEKPVPAIQRPRLRSKPASPRKPVPRPRQPIVEEVEEEEEVTPEIEVEPTPPKTRANYLSGRRNQKLSVATRQRALPTPKTTPATELEEDSELAEPEEALEPEEEPLAPAAPAKPQRPSSVRVVKRPFLPSRGGSPYLPRGLQPVGLGALKPALSTTQSTPLDMGSTISGVRLLEHGAPLLRSEDDPPLRTTLPPRSALPATPKRPEQPPKLNLDELYENDYDVTLNDALDPTLKPLSHPHQHSPTHQLQYQNRPSVYNPFAYQLPPSSASPSQPAAAAAAPAAGYNSDSYFSSTDIRRRAIIPAQGARPNRHEYAAAGGSSAGALSPQIVGGRHAQHFYDDFAY